MLRSMSWKQFLEWQTFETLEPFDETRADYRTAQIVTALANIYRKKGSRAKKLEDVVLLFGDSEKPKKAQTWQEQKNIARFWSSMFNAQEKSKADKAAAKTKKRRR